MRVARTVLGGGKSVRIYLSQLWSRSEISFVQIDSEKYVECTKVNNSSIFNSVPYGSFSFNTVKFSPIRRYSTGTAGETSNPESIFIALNGRTLSPEFIEWFRGFTDGEGSFYIQTTRGNSNVQFCFEISLHVDDTNVLNYIHNSLGLGKIYIKNNRSTFIVRNLNDVAVIIDIFFRNTLNTSKYLNFLDFKLAYDLYMDKDQGGADNIIARILAIKGQMNKNRTNFDLGQDHVINITLDWFIGFLEGEGCFNYSPDKNLFSFVVVQKDNLPLMEGIRDFLNNRSDISLNLVDSTEESAGAKVYSGKADSKGKIVNEIKVRQLDFIIKVLIPLLDSANWRSKKEKDYKDWKAIFSIVELGLHYTDDGKLIIERILAQMNNNRLSTNKTHSDEDRALLLSDISLLISKGSNYINKDGKIFIKSLNRPLSTNKKVGVEVVEVSSGEVIDTFNSVSELAKKLEINLQTAHYRVKNISKFTSSKYNEKLIYIKKIVN